jgi:hypothetical protein
MLPKKFVTMFSTILIGRGRGLRFDYVVNIEIRLVPGIAT